MLSKHLKNPKGFTLIELLIVIVIIGILAGVAISVVDPKKQQDRAHDASVKATINKAALSTEGYVSAYGEAPPPNEFIAGLKNIKSETCLASSDGVSCNFEVEGNPLPATCGSDGWTGSNSDTGQCLYHYVRNDPDDASADSTQFNIFARSFGLSNSVFKYDNNKGVLLVCPGDGVTSEVLADGGGCSE